MSRYAHIVVIEGDSELETWEALSGAIGGSRRRRRCPVHKHGLAGRRQRRVRHRVRPQRKDHNMTTTTKHKPPAELWGVFEVAEYLNVSKPNLSGKNIPAGMPAHVAEVKATRLWYADEIKAWAPEFFERRERYRPTKPIDDSPEPVAA